jgi:hypothetical protein
MRWKYGIDNLQLQWDKAQTDLQREKVQTNKVEVNYTKGKPTNYRFTN